MLARFVLILLEKFILFFRHFHIDATRRMIGVEAIHVHAADNFVFLVFDCVVTGLFAHIVVILEDCAIVRLFLATVPKICFHKQFAARQSVAEIGISVRNGILRENRSENCVENEYQYDARAHDRAFVFAKARESVRHVTTRFRGKRFFVQQVLLVHELEFFLGDVLIDLFHII